MNSHNHIHSRSNSWRRPLQLQGHLQIVTALLLTLLAGCASEKPIDPWTRDKDAVLAAIKSNQQQNRAFGQQIQELTRQIIKLQQTDKQQVSQLTAMEASIHAINERQGKLIISSKQHLANKGTPATTTARGLKRTLTKLPTLEEKLAKVEQDLDHTLKNTAVKPITDSGTIENSQPTATTPTTKVKPVVSKPIDPIAEKNSYSAAYLSLKSGRFEDAGNKLLAHLKKFPHGSLTDQALYWLGESYLAQQRNREALKALQQLIRDYPRSGKYGAALLRIASLYEQQDRKGDAKAAYLQLIQTQPNSSAAERARARLTALQ
ncbi:MAG: tol-pal system protein YbgF [Mariprofundales bacterium]|nr:tol-pal system protein YbgF [Mariprofundales bacterium]